MNTKYENGYLPKIEYWKGKLNEAIEAGNVNGVAVASQKLQYFMTRQGEVYGNTIIAGVDFADSLKQLNSLSIF
jgi:hypothetical protein